MTGRQTTLKSAVSCDGVGLHSGAPVALCLCPAAPNTGVVFVRTDVSPPVEIPAQFDAVTHTMLGTNVSGAGGLSVATVEHLMSALYGLGVDNVRIEVSGPEIPIMDGSAGAFVDLIDAAGVTASDGARNVLKIMEPVEIADGDKLARLEPSDGADFSFEIVFDTPVIGRQAREIRLTPETYRAEIGRARTFGFLKDAEALRAAGMALGAGLDNTIVIDGDRMVNETPLRYPDEFVRHKILDAVGDLALAGAPLRGRFVGVKAGHALNNRLLKALFANPAAYALVPA